MNPISRARLWWATHEAFRHRAFADWHHTEAARHMNLVMRIGRDTLARAARVEAKREPR